MRTLLGLGLSIVVLGCGVDSSLSGGEEEELTTTTAALTYTSGDAQFAGGFNPSSAIYGGFGGASPCTVTRTPVVFIPGNGDDARNFDYPSSTGVPSVYDAFKAAGYKDCELFGVNWASTSERANPTANYHTYAKAQRVANFISAVLTYTGATKVDVIGHSMGATIALHAIERFSLQSKLRRFISISGGLKGLQVCYQTGYANPYFPTCGSQNFYDSDIFGFYPSYNTRMENNGFRDVPARITGATFYSLRADVNDQIACQTSAFTSGCGATALFDARSNVASQLDVGSGSTTLDVDFDWQDGSGYNAGGGDLDGVGHFRAKNNTGSIQVKMLGAGCTGTACCTGYAAICGN